MLGAFGGWRRERGREREREKRGERREERGRGGGRWLVYHQGNSSTQDLAHTSMSEVVATSPVAAVEVSGCSVEPD